MQKSSYYVVNGITFFRVLAAPVLVALVFLGRPDIFKWLLLAAFASDMVDGYLARKFNVGSALGSRLDSVGDDLIILAAIIALVVGKPEFIRQEWPVVSLLIALFIIQTLIALYRYKRMTSFHTYLAKIAALFQGIFILLAFFLDEVPYGFFHFSAIITAVELMEEIIIVLMLPKWETNVKTLYHVLRRRSSRPL